MKKEEIDVINIEDAQIIFKNFSGIEQKFNPEGKRNFCVILDPSKVDVGAIVNDGWNVRWLEPREEGDERTPYLQVGVSWNNPRYTPKILVTTGKNNPNTYLNEATVSQLDTADIISVDLVLRPYEYDVNGKSGIKAYAKSMYITVEEDIFESKYIVSNIPNIPNE